MNDINNYIPSFGDFLFYCKESDIEQELFTEILFEFLDNPKKYYNLEIVKNYLNVKLNTNQYIQLISRLDL